MLTWLSMSARDFRFSLGALATAAALVRALPRGSATLALAAAAVAAASLPPACWVGGGRGRRGQGPGVLPLPWVPVPLAEGGALLGIGAVLQRGVGLATSAALRILARAPCWHAWGGPPAAPGGAGSRRGGAAAAAAAAAIVGVVGVGGSSLLHPAIPLVLGNAALGLALSAAHARLGSPEAKGRPRAVGAAGAAAAAAAKAAKAASASASAAAEGVRDARRWLDIYTVGGLVLTVRLAAWAHAGMSYSLPYSWEHVVAVLLGWHALARAQALMARVGGEGSGAAASVALPRSEWAAREGRRVAAFGVAVGGLWARGNVVEPCLLLAAAADALAWLPCCWGSATKRMVKTE